MRRNSFSLTGKLSEHRKMSNHDHLLLRPEEIIEILKKRYIDLNQVDGKSINENEITPEDINELVINNETEKFLELFDKVFSEEEELEGADSEDGFILDLCSRIAIRIKEKLTKLASADKSRLLNFIFKFVKDIVANNNDNNNNNNNNNGQDKSSSA